MKKLLGILPAFLLLATAAFAANPYPAISQDELKQAIADKSVVLLDANGSDSYRTGHIPGAIDFAANKDHLASLLPANKYQLVVAYCGGEKCQAYQAAADAAIRLGYMNVRHFAPELFHPLIPGAKCRTFM